MIPPLFDYLLRLGDDRLVLGPFYRIHSTATQTNGTGTCVTADTVTFSLEAS